MNIRFKHLGKYFSMEVQREYGDYCILCGGPCRETELWNLASKKLGEQMEKMLEELGGSDEPANH